MTFELIFMIDMAIMVCMSTWHSVVIDRAMVHLVVNNQSVTHARLYGYV